MISLDKIEKLYHYIEYTSIIRTEDLKLIGFNYDDITNLIEQNIIKRIAKGKYIIVDENKEFRDFIAEICKSWGWEKTFQIRKNQYLMNKTNANGKRLILAALKQRDFEFVINLCVDMLNNVSNVDKRNIYAILYLLGQLVSLPEEVEQIIKDITIKDLLHSKEYDGSNKLNELMELIMANKLDDLWRTSQYDITISKYKTLDIYIYNELAYNIRQKQKEISQEVAKLITIHEYQKAVDYILSKKDKRYLTTYEEYWLTLLYVIIDIYKYGNSYKTEEVHSENVFDSIDNYNYQEALSLSEEYLINKGYRKETNSIHLLLEEICSLLYQSIDENHIIYPSVPAIIKLIDNENSTRFIKCIKAYLRTINKSNYELIVRSIVSIIKNNGITDYDILNEFLVALADKSFDLDNYFLDKYYSVIKEENIEKSKAYLIIINGLKEYKLTEMFNDVYLNLLNNYYIELLNRNNRGNLTLKRINPLEEKK